MYSFAKDWFLILAMVAALLLGISGGAGTGHVDCGSGEDTCACVCHDAVALHSQPTLVTPPASVAPMCAVISVVDLLIQRDIFRPPLA